MENLNKFELNHEITQTIDFINKLRKGYAKSSQDKDNSLFQLRDEIMSNTLGVLENCINPIIYKGFEENIFFYPQNNSIKRFDILNFNKEYKYISWDTYLLNNEKKMYDNLGLIFYKPFNFNYQFRLVIVKYEKENFDKQMTSFKRAIENNYIEPFNQNWGNKRTYGIGELKTKDQVENIFIFHDFI